jgi:hypothetical protein
MAGVKRKPMSSKGDKYQKFILYGIRFKINQAPTRMAPNG